MILPSGPRLFAPKSLLQEAFRCNKYFSVADIADDAMHRYIRATETDVPFIL
jgi:hypothetical protein